MHRIQKTICRVQTATAPAYSIVKYSLLLCLFLFAGAICVLVWAGDYSLQTLYLYFLAQAMADQALPVFLIGTIGSVLIEERLTQ